MPVETVGEPFLLKLSKATIIRTGSATSQTDARDLDEVFVLAEIDRPLVVLSGRNDVLLTSWDWLERYGRLLDPTMATEILLTGLVVQGEQERVTELKRLVEDQVADDRVLDHLIGVARWQLDVGRQMSSGPRIEYAVDAICYSQSYMMFHDHYAVGGSVATLAELLRVGGCDAVSDAFEARARLREGKALDPDALRNLLTQCETRLQERFRVG